MTDARIDVASMEMIVQASGPLDLDRVIQALREAGFDAGPAER